MSDALRKMMTEDLRVMLQDYAEYAADVEEELARRGELSKSRRVSNSPTRDPHKILPGDVYESRDVCCARCSLVHLQAPWPKHTHEVINRPRCSECGSMFTYPIANGIAGT